MRKLFRSALFVVLALGFIVICFLLTAARPTTPVMPVPNGYDDFLKAAQNAVSHEHLAYGEASDAELRDLVTENRSALELARLGCQRDCRVTTDYHRNIEAYMAAHMPVLGEFKKIGLAFRAEGELAEREGRTNDAARVYLDGIRFGQEVCRGGLLIDRLVGIACERMNLQPLQALVPGLGAAICRQLARDLEQTEAGREPIQATWDEERLWVRRVGDLRGRVALLITRVLRPKVLQAPRQNSAAKVADLQARQRELMLQFASRAYELEHGKPPERPGDLVPEYLLTIPKDPVTGQAMALPR